MYCVCFRLGPASTSIILSIWLFRPAFSPPVFVDMRAPECVCLYTKPMQRENEREKCTWCVYHVCIRICPYASTNQYPQTKEKDKGNISPAERQDPFHHLLINQTIKKKETIEDEGQRPLFFTSRESEPYDRAPLGW